MDLKHYAVALTGLPEAVLFAGLERAPVAFDRRSDGSITVLRWDVELTRKPAPSDEDLAAAELMPTPPVILLAYASDKQNAVLAGTWSFNVAAAGRPAHAVTTLLDDKGQFAMIKVDVWAQTNAGNASASLPYSNVDYTATSLNPAEASSLAAQAGVIDAQSYGILNTLSAGIKASPPTITTTDQIDAAFAAMVQPAAA